MYEFDKICFEGCGIFAIIYVGAIAYLEEQGLLQNVNAFAGSSSGSIMASALALGYSSEELYVLLKELDWKKFYDRNLNFFSGYGLYKGNKLHQFFKTLVKNKTNSENTTFYDLYEKTKKKLYICAINANTQKSVYFSVDSHPFMEIHLAIRLSASFPLIFKTLQYKGDYYVDGGVMDNYPIEVFEDDPKVLGFNLETNVLKQKKIEGIISFIKNIIGSMSKTQNILELHPYRSKTVCIYNEVDDLLTSVVDIGDMKESMAQYYKLGYDTTKTFFEHT